MRYWIKLYTEIVSDPKMGRLSDRQFRTCINLFALAGIEDQDGALPPLADMVWYLRTDADTLQQDLIALARYDILDQEDGIWYVTHWDDRQAKPPSASREAVRERVARSRERERERETPDSLQSDGNEDCNADAAACNDVTDSLHAERNDDVTRIERKEKNREEQNAPAPLAPTVSTPPVATDRAPIVALPVSLSASAGRRHAARMQTLDAKLGPQLRTPLAQIVLEITGTRALADLDTDAGSNALYAAHEAVVSLWGLGYKTDGDLLAVEGDWYTQDFRGKQQEKPTCKQLVEHAAKLKAAARPASQAARNGNGNGPPPNPHANRREIL